MISVLPVHIYMYQYIYARKCRHEMTESSTYQRLSYFSMHLYFLNSPEDYATSLFFFLLLSYNNVYTIYTIRLLNLLEIYILTIPSAGGAKKNQNSHIAGDNKKMIQPLWKTFCQVLIMLNILQILLSNHILSIYQSELKYVHTKIYLWVVIAVLLKIAKIWK